MSMVDRFVTADEYSKTFDEKKMSQKEACLDYLKKYGSITPLEALTAFNSLRLSSIIFRLRNEGHQIDTKINEEGKPFAVYTLIREGEESDG